MPIPNNRWSNAKHSGLFAPDRYELLSRDIAQRSARQVGETLRRVPVVGLRNFVGVRFDKTN